MWSWNVRAAERKNGLVNTTGSRVVGERSNVALRVFDGLSWELLSGPSFPTLAGCVGSIVGWNVENAVEGKREQSNSCDSTDNSRKLSKLRTSYEREE